MTEDIYDPLDEYAGKFRPRFEQVAKETGAAGAADGSVKAEPKRAGKKPGPNDPCPCGSGKKYKKCCYLKPDDPYK